jgi:hypothetical protein
MKALYKKDLVLSDSIYSLKASLLTKIQDYFEKNKTLETSEITGKMKSIVSQTDDISKIIRYLN